MTSFPTRLPAALLKEELIKMMVEKIEVKDTTFCFRIHKGCEEVGRFFIETILDAHAHTHVLGLLAKDLPKKVYIAIRSVREEVGGYFQVPNRITVNADTLRDLKEYAVDLESAKYEMLHLFFHECAHWLTRDEEEANEIASEWAVSAAH